MDRRIYKYEFEIGDFVEIDFPKTSTILKIECQGNQPCLWAMVDVGEISDPSRLMGDKQKFRIFGTGHPIPVNFDGKHIATFQQDPFVWHMFTE